MLVRLLALLCVYGAVDDDVVVVVVVDVVVVAVLVVVVVVVVVVGAVVVRIDWLRAIQRGDSRGIRWTRLSLIGPCGASRDSWTNTFGKSRMEEVHSWNHPIQSMAHP